MHQPMQKKNIVLLTAVATLLALVIAGALLAAAVVYSGWYDVASTRQHLQPTHTLLETAMRQSVRLRARDIKVPPLDDQRLVLRGAGCFRDKCVQCHGAPGVAQGDIGKSMQPLPGPLVDARKHWRARELYWLTRHGIKMSGMPAWEFRLSEAELWSVVAFMQRLPDLNAQQYASLVAQAPPPPACGRELQEAPAVAPGDAQRGKRALFQYACNACHTIPGVTSSGPQVGPPLRGIGSRALIAGVLPNTPANLERWLRETQQVKPMTAMPQMGVTAQDARDIAAYLGTLR
jgi:mono/diheme cytochrome c family protein